MPAAHTTPAEEARVSTTMEQTDRQVDWPEQIAEVREIGQEFAADVETLLVGARASR